MKPGRMIFSVPATDILIRLKCASATNTIIKGRIRQRTTVLLGTKTPAEDHDDSALDRVYRWNGSPTTLGREVGKTIQSGVGPPHSKKQLWNRLTPQRPTHSVPAFQNPSPSRRDVVPSGTADLRKRQTISTSGTAGTTRAWRQTARGGRTE